VSFIYTVFNFCNCGLELPQTHMRMLFLWWDLKPDLSVACIEHPMCFPKTPVSNLSLELRHSNWIFHVFPLFEKYAELVIKFSWFYFTVQCNRVIKYKLTNAPFLNLYFNFWCLLPRVHLQEDGCIYSYGRVRFTCISISSLTLMHVKHTIP
jgi:hypothetical protein